MPRHVDPKRDADIARALSEKQPPAAVAQNYGLTVSSIYRAAERFAAAQAQTPAKANPQAMPVRSLAGGPNFSGDARTGLRRFGGMIVDDYDRLFQTVYKRTQLYREMGDDPVAAAVLQACKMTLRRATIYAETEGESDGDKQARDFLEQAWNDMAQSGTDTIDQAANMLQYGFYAAEVVYKKRNGPQPERVNIQPNQQGITSSGVVSTGPGSSKFNDGRIGWRKWTFMAPETLAPGREWIFDETGGIQGLNQLAPPDYQFKTIPIQKMVLFRTTAEKGNPEGRSILRAMYRAWYFKNNLEEVEAISAERMGSGLPVVYLGNGTARQGAAGDDLDVFKDIMRNIRVDDQMGIVIPYQKMDPTTGDGVLLELMSPPSRGAIDFNQVISRYEQRMAMVGLAQFIHLGMNGVGARALGSVQQDFFTLAVSAWVDAILDTLNRYAVERLFSLNYFPGLTVLPKLSHEAIIETDIAKVASYVNLLVGAEVLTPTEDLERYLLELADMPQADDLSQLWDKRRTQQETMQALAQQAAAMPANQPPQAAKPQTVKPAGMQPATAKVEKQSMSDESDLADALREATDALRASERQEQFALAWQHPPQAPNVTVNLPDNLSIPAAPAPNFTIANNFENVTMPLPEGFAFTKPDAPVVNVHVPEQPAPIVNVTQPEIVIPAPVINFPEGFGNQPQPNVLVNVPPAQVNVRATLEMPDTEAETTVEQDPKTGRISKTRTRTRKVKNGNGQ